MDRVPETEWPPPMRPAPSYPPSENREDADKTGNDSQAANLRLQIAIWIGTQGNWGNGHCGIRRDLECAGGKVDRSQLMVIGIPPGEPGSGYCELARTPANVGQ